MVDIEKMVKDEIIALIPLYVDNKGNSTKIITNKSNSIILYKTIRTALKLLAKYFMIDLSSARKYYGDLIGSSNVIPIPFSSDNILVPIKTRRPISKNDGSFSYINLRFIKNIHERDNGVYILMEGNVEIKCIQNIKTVKKHISQGRIVKKIYDERQKILVMEKKADFYSEYLKPATKGDIALLRDELIAIKSRLR